MEEDVPTFEQAQLRTLALTVKDEPMRSSSDVPDLYNSIVEGLHDLGYNVLEFEDITYDEMGWDCNMDLTYVHLMDAIVLIADRPEASGTNKRSLFLRDDILYYE